MKLLLIALSILTAQTTTSFVLNPPSRTSILRVAATEPELEEGDVVLFTDADFPPHPNPIVEASMPEDEPVEEEIRKPHRRWSSLKPVTKHDMQKAKVDRVVQQRQESKQDKKRRIMFFMKEAGRARKNAARIARKIPLGDMRAPLRVLRVGVKLTGQVISLTNFGAYVDIGTECDGLLHISQMSNTYFVEHPKYYLEPGQDVQVTIKSLNPEAKKLHLTMLEESEEDEDDDDTEERIDLEELEIDDELWGEIVRVTDYGSYVEVGAMVTGFVHFMDHPLFGDGAHPSEYMRIGERVRVWVSDVDMERKRIKMTANRPAHLPGPRREF